MNLTELRTRVDRYGFNSTDPRDSWINEAMHEIEEDSDWPFLDAEATIATAVGSNTVTLPADLYVPYSVRRELDSTYLDYYDKVKFERMVQNKTDPGSPLVYTMVGLTGIRFWPVPNVVENVVVFYQKSLPDLVLTTDVPGIPLRHHRLIVYRAAAIGLMAENEEDRAAVAQDVYEAGLQKMRSSLSRKQKGQPATVQDVMGYT